MSTITGLDPSSAHSEAGVTGSRSPQVRIRALWITLSMSVSAVTAVSLIAVAVPPDDRSGALAITLLTSLAALIMGARVGAWVAGPLQALSRAVTAYQESELVPLPRSSLADVDQLSTAFGDLRACLAARTAERERAAEELRRGDERFRALVRNISDVIAILDESAVARYISPSIEQVLGYRAEELLGVHLLAWAHRDDAARMHATFLRTIAEDGHEPQCVEFRVRHRDGTWRYLEALTVKPAEASLGGIIMSARDVTERKQLEDQLVRQAFYDSLTDLPNRALFADRLAHALAGAERRSGRVAVLFLDLDGFKVVNDSLGHRAGDSLLAAVAKRLVGSVRPGDTVARFGGDEFTILLEDLDEPAEAMQVADRVLDALRSTFTVDGRGLFVMGSIGVAVSQAGDGVLKPDDLIRQADVALYQAKGAGRARAALFDPALQVRAVERLDLETDLRQALGRGELRLYYQPEVDLVSGRIVGMEALLRWEHPRRGIISPDDFIPLAEETGCIVPIGRWVLEEACRQACLWQPPDADEDSCLLMSVNLSSRQFQEPDLAGQVATILDETGLHPRCLRLEITETVLMEDTPATAETLRQLKALGVHLAIDDFGTGYSSLSYLRRLLVDTLKIDRSFVATLGRDQSTTEIVRAVARLGQALGMEITAEGIERAEHLAWVRAVGCHRGQGFYFGEPLPADRMTALLDPPPDANASSNGQEHP